MRTQPNRVPRDPHAPSRTPTSPHAPPPPHSGAPAATATRAANQQNKRRHKTPSNPTAYTHGRHAARRRNRRPFPPPLHAHCSPLTRCLFRPRTSSHPTVETSPRFPPCRTYAPTQPCPPSYTHHNQLVPAAVRTEPDESAIESPAHQRNKTQHAAPKSTCAVLTEQRTTQLRTTETRLTRPRAQPRPTASPKSASDTTTTLYQRPPTPTPHDVRPARVACHPRRATKSMPYGHRQPKASNNQTAHDDAAAPRATLQPTRTVYAPAAHDHTTPPPPTTARRARRQAHINKANRAEHPPSIPQQHDTRCAPPPPPPPLHAHSSRLARRPPPPLHITSHTLARALAAPHAHPDRPKDRIQSQPAQHPATYVSM
jgi:hypothetical protein